MLSQINVSAALISSSIWLAVKGSQISLRLLHSTFPLTSAVLRSRKPDDTATASAAPRFSGNTQNRCHQTCEHNSSTNTLSPPASSVLQCDVFSGGLNRENIAVWWPMKPVRSHLSRFCESTLFAGAMALSILLTV